MLAVSTHSSFPLQHRVPSPFSPYARSPSFAGSAGWRQCLDLWQCQKSGLDEDNAEAAEHTEQKAACTEEKDDLGGGMQHLWECVCVVFIVSMVEERRVIDRGNFICQGLHVNRSVLLGKNCYFPRKLLPS